MNVPTTLCLIIVIIMLTCVTIIQLDRVSLQIEDIVTACEMDEV